MKLLFAFEVGDAGMEAVQGNMRMKCDRMEIIVRNMVRPGRGP